MTGVRGLTLVELTVTLAVVAAVAALGAPHLLASLPGLRASAAARQVLGDFRLARTLAVDRGRDVLLQFHSPGVDDYTVAVDTFPAGAGDGRITPDDEQVKVVRLAGLYPGIQLTTYPAGSGLPADGVDFADDRARFKPAGTSNGGTAYLRPAADAGRTRLRERKVTVLSATGRGRAYRWSGSGWE